MTLEEKFAQLKRGFNKLMIKKMKWKNRYYNAKRRRKLAVKFIGLLQEGVTNKVSYDTLQNILNDYYKENDNLIAQFKIQNELGGKLYGKRKRSKQR